MSQILGQGEYVTIGAVAAEQCNRIHIQKVQSWEAQRNSLFIGWTEVLTTCSAPQLKSIRGWRLWRPWMTVSSVFLNSTNKSFCSCSFYHHRGWKDPAWGILSLMTPLGKKAHTLASDQYQVFQEAEEFCKVMATPCDRWDATDITSSVDWLPALSAFWTSFDRSFFSWHDEIKGERLQRHFHFN